MRTACRPPPLRKVFLARSTSAATFAGSGATVSVPASMLPASRRFAMRPLMWSACPSMMRKNWSSSAWGGTGTAPSTVAVEPLIEVSGARSSWLTIPRNSARCRSSSSSGARSCMVTWRGRVPLPRGVQRGHRDQFPGAARGCVHGDRRAGHGRLARGRPPRPVKDDGEAGLGRGRDDHRLDALDSLGNENGRYDLGDMLAWAARCRGGEASGPAAGSGPPSPPPALPASGPAGGASRRRKRARGSSSLRSNGPGGSTTTGCSNPTATCPR